MKMKIVSSSCETWNCISKKNIEHPKKLKAPVYRLPMRSMSTIFIGRAETEKNTNV